MTIPQSISDRGSPSLACDLMAIPLKERARYRGLRLRLADSLESAKEIESGFVFEFSLERISADEITNWIDLERMCCPWISIQIGQIKRGTIAILILVPEHAKSVVRAEFSEWMNPDNG